MKNLIKLMIALTFWGISNFTHAGADLTGAVTIIQADPQGNIWFSINNSSISTYCQVGWYGLTMYIPSTSPQVKIYYAMLLAALTTGKQITIANISTYNGTTQCDITKTGYGIVILPYT